LGGDYGLVEQIKRDFGAAPVSEKLKALLGIAGKVRKGGKHVTAEDVERAGKALRTREFMTRY
jgi:hypothetical protein